MNEEYVWVITRTFIHVSGSTGVELLWVSKTGEGAEHAVYDFIEEYGEKFYDCDMPFDNEIRYFTNKSTYVIERCPVNN